MTTFLAAIASVGIASAQLNIVSPGDGIVEYTADNALPYDSLTPFHQTYKVYPRLPGQVLFFQGEVNDPHGYADAFYTGNPLKGDATIYRKREEGNFNSTVPEAVVGKYFDVVKVFVKQNSRYCLLLRERQSGDMIYYKPGIITDAHFVCVGNYEKMKQLHLGRTFYSLGKRADLVGGGTECLEARLPFKAVDIAVELRGYGAYLILEGTDGKRYKASPYGNVVEGFVKKEHLDSLIARFGKDDGEKIAFETVEPGMTVEMLKESFGEPFKVTRTTFKGKAAELWWYPEGYSIVVQRDRIAEVWQYRY